MIHLIAATDLQYNIRMLTLDILILGLALAMDAAVASFALGVLGSDLPGHHKLARGLYLATLFGVFQFVMLWAGSRGGYYFSFSDYGHLFQLLIAGIFLLIGGKVVIDTFSDEEKPLTWGIVPSILIAIATSLDALAAGVSLGTLPEAHIAALEVGVITFFMSAGFYTVSLLTQKIPANWMQRVAGVIFIILGLRIILSYMRLGGL